MAMGRAVRAASNCSSYSRRRSSSICAFSFCREASNPPSRINSRMRVSSSLSNHVPWPLQTSTITPEQRAKLIRFISCAHRGHGTYLTGAASSAVLSGAGEAPPSTADCCSRLAQILSNDCTSNQSPWHLSHSSTAVVPKRTGQISIRHRGQLWIDSPAFSRTAAAAPHR